MWWWSFSCYSKSSVLRHVAATSLRTSRRQSIGLPSVENSKALFDLKAAVYGARECTCGSHIVPKPFSKTWDTLSSWIAIVKAVELFQSALERVSSSPCATRSQMDSAKLCGKESVEDLEERNFLRESMVAHSRETLASSKKVKLKDNIQIILSRGLQSHVYDKYLGVTINRDYHYNQRKRLRSEISSKGCLTWGLNQIRGSHREIGLCLI